MNDSGEFLSGREGAGGNLGFRVHEAIASTVESIPYDALLY